MARVNGPLFSMNASGTVGRALTMRNIGRAFIASRPPVPSGPPTTAQLSERQSMRDAAAAWANLSANDRAVWSTPTVPTTRHGFMSFFLEWKTQQIRPGSVPLIPADYLGTPTRSPWPDPVPPPFVGNFTLHHNPGRRQVAPAVDHNRGTIAAHGARPDWLHGIAYDHSKPDRTAHAGPHHFRLDTPAAKNRGTLRVPFFPYRQQRL